MKKELMFIVVSFLILTSCTGVQYGKTKEQVAALEDTHKGTKGVTIDFVKNNPPDVVFTGNPLDVVIQVKNEGAAQASGTIFLSGFDTKLFNLYPANKEFNLDGRSKFNTFGGYDTIQFSSGKIYLPAGTETLNQTFQASVCYYYRTEARIPVCVDPNPYSMVENEACKVTTPTVSGGQGGPVSITAIREDAAPSQVNFLITVSNVGDGFVIDKGSKSKCPSPLGFNDVDTVDYSVKLSGQTGDCKPTGKLRLSNKQGTLYCTFKLADSTSPAYTTVLEVNLDYTYLSQKSKTIKVKSLN